MVIGLPVGGMPPKEDEGTLMQKRSERVHEMTKVDDLEGPRAPPYIPLCIQVGRTYLLWKLTEVLILFFIGSFFLWHYLESKPHI